MKKRREILAAMREDSRISSLEGQLQRVSSEAEAYRRFAERGSESTESSGSRNQIEQLQQLLQEEQKKSAQLRSELNLYKLETERERDSLEQVHRDELERLGERLARAQQLVAEARSASPKASSPNSSSGEATGGDGEPRSSSGQDGAEGKFEEARVHRAPEGPATVAAREREAAVEIELRLAQIAIKQLERSLERETRRADRATAEASEALARAEDLTREQQVKDSQLDAMRTDLQELLAHGNGAGAAPVTPRTPRRSASLTTLGIPALALGRESKAGDEGESKEDLTDSSALRECLGENQGSGDEGEGSGDFDDVIAEELESMRVSYERKLAKMRDELDAAKREIRSLNGELSARR